MAIVTWDPASGLHATYSGGNLIWSEAGGGGSWDCFVRATQSYSTGKLYCETSRTDSAAGSGNGALGMGIINGSYTANFLGASANSAGYYISNGSYIGMSGASGNANPSTSISNICIAIDYAAKLWWSRIANGNWNNSGAADPATGTGGASFSSVTGPYFLAMASNLNGNGATTNFGATSFVESLPAGFSGYSSSPIVPSTRNFFFAA